MSRTALGKVLIATCSPNESSWYYHGSGGYFWNSFLNCFMNVVSFTYTGSAVKWADIFNDAIAQTTKLTKEDDVFGEQHPFVHFELNE